VPTWVGWGQVGVPGSVFVLIRSAGRCQTSPPVSSAETTYLERVAAAKASLARLDARGGRLANLRLATFLLAVGLALATLFGKLPGGGFLAALAVMAGYTALAVRHAKVLREERTAKTVLLLNQRGLQRLAGKWRDFPSQGERYRVDGHLYAGDLDVFGHGSLFQRLDETSTEAGEKLLAGWLSAPTKIAVEISGRQAALKELAAQIDFRQRLVSETRQVVAQKADPSRFIRWVENGSSIASLKWAFVLAHLLPVVTFGLWLGVQLRVLLDWVPYVGLGLQIAVVVITSRRLAEMYGQLTMGELGFVQFEHTFEAIDAQQFSDPLLCRLKSGLSTGGPPVSQRLKHFERLHGFASLRSAKEIHWIINALLLWDLHFLFRIERWRSELGTGVRGWFESLAQLEALSSMATWVYENPAYAWPEVDEGPVHFQAVQLGHPLLDNPVRNDLALDGPGTAVVITGSNMSGKTTLMRAMGLNTVIALAGMPVCARSFQVSVVQVLTSMRVKDSLERGVSYFYAEVQRIKAVLDVAKANPNQTLFLLDELLMGTNTRERQIASRELMRMLLSTGASGALTTHDLSLTELASYPGVKVRNVHFRDLEKDGEMTFDYVLRDGVVETTNALEVLRRAGVDIP